MAEIERIFPDEAHRKVAEGTALLVCAYEDEETCARLKLQGAVTMKELAGKLPSLSKDQEIIFYCA